MRTSVLTKKQEITKRIEGFPLDGGEGSLVIKIRYDDQCGNGHNSFSITGTLYRNHQEYGWGCLHDEIRQYASEYAHLIKWHGMTSEGPTHYIANTMYHASDRDCNGLRKGEKRQIINVVSKLPCWELGIIIDKKTHRVCIDDFTNTVNALETSLPTLPTGLLWIPLCRTGKGKEPNLENARKCAIWEDATLEQLQDKVQLENRLPALIEEFAQVVESLNMTF